MRNVRWLINRDILTKMNNSTFKSAISNMQMSKYAVFQLQLSSQTLPRKSVYQVETPEAVIRRSDSSYSSRPSSGYHGRWSPVGLGSRSICMSMCSLLPYTSLSLLLTFSETQHTFYLCISAFSQMLSLLLGTLRQLKKSTVF